MSERPPWLQRWLQTDDDELLYVDQTLLWPTDVTLDEQGRLVQRQEGDTRDECDWGEE